GGSAPSRAGGSAYAARKRNSPGHFFGFLALPTLPSAASSRAWARSPSSPRSPTALAFNPSPCIDLTRQRHNPPTAPTTSPAPAMNASCAPAPFSGSYHLDSGQQLAADLAVARDRDRAALQVGDGGVRVDPQQVKGRGQEVLRGDGRLADFAAEAVGA